MRVRKAIRERAVLNGTRANSTTTARHLRF